MRLTLTPHPASPPSAATGIDVEIARDVAGTLSILYLMSGTIGALRMPPLAVSERVDGLWQQTCFEAFIRSPFDNSYYEFNFAPSTRWAAYRLSGYRFGMVDADISQPGIIVRSDREGFELRAELDLGSLSDLPADEPWHLGLSAIAEETSGRKSYWALAHPPGEPDFHHEDCFALQLPPAA